MTKRIEDLQVFFSADYSQIEIRMLAEAANDKLLIKQFNTGQDIHCLVGHELTGWPVEKIDADKDVRTSVKAFHFSLVYGVSEKSMYGHMKGKGIKITKSKVSEYFVNYFGKYYGVKAFMDLCRRQVEAKGYVDTLFGFRRRIYQKDANRGSYWGNQAINTPIQGSAHQLVLMAMAMIDLKPRTYNLLQVPVMEVHDELMWRVRFGDLPEAYAQVKSLLEKDVVKYAERHFGRKLRVPLLAEVEVGFTLGSQFEYKGGPLEEALENWRKKYRKIIALPLTTLLPKRKLV